MGSLEEEKEPWVMSGLRHSAGPPSLRCLSRDLPRAGGRIVSGGEHPDPPPEANSKGSLRSAESSQKRSSSLLELDDGLLLISEFANKLEDPSSSVFEESRELSVVKSKGGGIVESSGS